MRQRGFWAGLEPGAPRGRALASEAQTVRRQRLTIILAGLTLLVLALSLPPASGR
jgi:hypothetical protein